MNDCFLNLLFSFQLLLPLKDGADFVGSKQTIDVILSDLSLLGYVIPVGGLGIGLFICLLAYLAAEYNVRFQSHEKYKIAMNMLHSIHTPLTLLRNQLEDIKTASLSEPISLKIEEVLKYAERLIRLKVVLNLRQLLSILNFPLISLPLLINVGHTQTSVK